MTGHHGPHHAGDLSAQLGRRAFTLDDLAHLNRMTTIGLVLPTVAHEINNALQVVGGLTELLSRRDDLPGDVRDKLRRIAAQSSRASGLLRELVNYTKREASAPAVVDVVRVLEAALAMRRYHLDRERVRVHVSLPDDFACLCRTDAHYLQQVLLNLILNAETALRGRPEPALWVAVTATEREVRVQLEDNGPGLEGDATTRAFEPFYSTRAGHALGLGLAVSKALMRRSGGDLDVHTRREGGTRAVITLPRVEAP